MRTRILSSAAPLRLSRIGLGCWAIGGEDWAFGWGPQEDADSIATIRSAIDLGINWLDTAPVYGLGHSEAIVARALADVPAADRPYVFTKCGLVWSRKGKVRHCLEAISLRREIDDSLKRLRVEVIDLCQIHWPSYPPGAPADRIEEAWGTLAELQRLGKVRHIGVSNFDVVQLDTIRPIAAIASLQPPYSLVRREIEDEILPYCVDHQIGVIAYSPLASGLLSGQMTRERVAGLPATDWRRSKSLDFQEPRLSANLTIVERLREVGERAGCSAPEVAISWVLRHPAVTAAIVGARRPEQIAQAAAAAELELDDGEARILAG